MKAVFREKQKPQKLHPRAESGGKGKAKTKRRKKQSYKYHLISHSRHPKIQLIKTKTNPRR